MKHYLSAGGTAPNFTVTDVMGKKICLADYEGKSVLLVFLRYAGCPWCNLAIHRLTLEYPLLKKNGCEVIAFVQSDTESIMSNIYKRHVTKPPFPIIADPFRAVYDQYHINNSVLAAALSITKIPSWVHAVKEHGFKQTKLDGSFFLVPATFLIGDAKRKILIAHYGLSFYEHETFTGIYEKLNFTG